MMLEKSRLEDYHLPFSKLSCDKREYLTNEYLQTSLMWTYSDISVINWHSPLLFQSELFLSLIFVISKSLFINYQLYRDGNKQALNNSASFISSLSQPFLHCGAAASHRLLKNHTFQRYWLAFVVPKTHDKVAAKIILRKACTNWCAAYWISCEPVWDKSECAGSQHDYLYEYWHRSHSKPGCIWILACGCDPPQPAPLRKDLFIVAPVQTKNTLGCFSRAVQDWYWRISAIEWGYRAVCM